MAEVLQYRSQYIANQSQSVASPWCTASVPCLVLCSSLLSGLLRSDQNNLVDCSLLLGARNLDEQRLYVHFVTSATPFTLASPTQNPPAVCSALYSSALSPSSAALPPPPHHTPPRPPAARSIAFSALPHYHPSVGARPWAQQTSALTTHSTNSSTSTTPHHHARRPSSSSHPRRLRPSIALHTRTRQSPCRHPVNITPH
jgi:hypothetical protein